MGWCEEEHGEGGERGARERGGLLRRVQGEWGVVLCQLTRQNARQGGGQALDVWHLCQQQHQPSLLNNTIGYISRHPYTHHSMGEAWLVPLLLCRWFAKNEDDGAIRRRLRPSDAAAATTSYRVTTYTGDVRGAGTDAEVWVELVGELEGKEVGGSEPGGGGGGRS